MVIDCDRLQTESCHILHPRGGIKAKEHVVSSPVASFLILAVFTLHILFSSIFPLHPDL